MTDDLVKRLRVLDPVHHLPVTFSQYCYAAADRIEQLEYALRSIAEVSLEGKIPDRLTIWGLATYMQETAKYALKEGKDEQR